MQLYAWQPGYGKLSFFVMAESEASAIEAVKRKIAECNALDSAVWDSEGFDEDSYQVKVVESGTVLVNRND